MGVVYLAPGRHGADRSQFRGDESTDHLLPLPEENARLRADESPLWDEEYSGDVLSLLEENARLRKLVIELSNLMLRDFADHDKTSQRALMSQRTLMKTPRI
jgi:hypothetical protein